MATGTKVANFDEMMKAKAAMYKKTVAAVSLGQFISFKSGVLSVDKSPIKDNRLDIVILDFVLCNTYYPGKFDANNSKPPACYAFAREAEGMAPHEQVKNPQHGKCDGCEFNEFGSANEGRGKACKNSIRAACVAADGLTAKNVSQAELRYIQVPVTSVPGFAGFVRQCGEVLHKAPFMVICEMAVVPDVKTQIKVTFNPKESIKDKALLEGLYRRSEAVEKQIMFPFPEEQEQAGHGARGQGRKAVAKRKKF